MDLKNLGHQPKYSIIMEIVRKRITNGTYCEDKMLPSERALAKEFKTNHETVNKALSNLVAEGLIYRKRGVGTFISGREQRGSAHAQNLPPTIDIFTYGKAEDLFHSQSLFEEVLFTLQNLITRSGYNSRIVPVKDVLDVRTYIDKTNAAVISEYLPLDLIRAIKAKGIPLIGLNCELEGPRASAFLAENNAVDQLVDHLYKRGHHDILFVGSRNFNHNHELRRLRFLRRMELLQLKENLQRTYRIDLENKRSAEKLAKEFSKCSAVMAADDYLAVQLQKFFARHSIRVPEDISLTGFGNLSITRTIFPTLTTADINRESVCREVVEEASSLLDPDKEGCRKFFPTHMITRSSVAKV